MAVEAGTSMNCSACNKAAADLKQCGVCGTAKYCSVDCQKSDWAVHKPVCTKAATLQLIDAVSKSNAETVRRLANTKRVLNGKVDYRVIRDGSPSIFDQWTALHECVRTVNTEMMKILIEKGANLEVVDVDGETPLFVATTSSNPQPACLLLKAGANPNASGEDGWTCLMMAARDGNYEVTKALLDAGADLHGGGDMFGRNALHIVEQFKSGQGMRMSDGESFEDAKAKYARLYTLLKEYA